MSTRGGSMQEIMRQRAKRGRTQDREVSRETATKRAEEGAKRTSESKDRKKSY